MPPLRGHPRLYDRSTNPSGMAISTISQSVAAQRRGLYSTAVRLHLCDSSERREHTKQSGLRVAHTT